MEYKKEALQLERENQELREKLRALTNATGELENKVLQGENKLRNMTQQSQE